MASFAPSALHSAKTQAQLLKRECAVTCRAPVAPFTQTKSARKLQRSCRITASSTGGSGGSGGGGGPPPSRSGLAGWAASSFRDAARNNLTKACLLLALEEESAAQAAYAEAEAVGEDASLGSTVGSASTWSLDRVAGLAEEAAAAFYQQLLELGVVGDELAAAARGLPDSTLLTVHMDLVCSYPTQLISAVNHVLFDRHGYRRQRAHGNPLDSRLSNVLENGNGTSGALTVLYLEICERLSLPLQPVSLEGGRFFVLLPADDCVSLAAAGERFCIDPFAKGMLLSESEVCELFEVEGGRLEPCSNEDVLAGILRVLIDSHWCAAVGCPPEPILMVPCCLKVALGDYRDVEVETTTGEDEEGEYFRVSFTEPVPVEEREAGGQRWWPQRGYNLQRAVAAAQKRCWMLPSDTRALLELGLLLYFDQQYEEAWQELGCVLQAAKSEPAGQETFSLEEVEQLELLWEKVRLQLAFAAS